MNIEQITFPQLCPADALESPLPLEHTEVSVRVAGLAAIVTVSQRFRNPLTEKADLEYLFPLPHETAITAFDLRIGKRVIHAGIKEMERARQQFEDARGKGKRAGLLETRRPNLFSLQLANIQPGEFIEAVVTYQQRLEFNSGQVEYVFPMGITPKYHRPGHPEEAEGVNAPVALDLTQVGDVEITLEADTGLKSSDPVSPTHPLIISRKSDTRFIIKLDGAHLPNRDFVLRWQMEGAGVQFPVWHTSAENAGTFMATFIPPMPDLAAAPIPREMVFVLDRSGSMNGGPLRQAVNALRACLRSLNPQDTFTILLFDHQLDWLSGLQKVTQTTIDEVDNLLAKVDARGGTEILPALSAALSLPADPERSRVVIFLTDGSASAEGQTLKEVRGQMGTARLFTFGVGPSVNRAFLKQLADIGRGQSEFIGLDEDIEDAILRFQDRIAFPLFTNLSLEAEGGQIWDVYPAQLPDLYAGCPLEVVGRYKTGSTLTLIARGERMGQPLEMRAEVYELAPDPMLIPRLWARARVDDLTEQTDLRLKPDHEARTEIISLALEYSLLTKYTAFLAVDQKSALLLGKSYFIKVAQPLPEGLNFAAGFPAPAPQTLFQMAVRDMDVPTFMRSRKINENSEMAVPLGTVFEPKPATPVFNPASVLRELARTQQLNGSWEEDVEHTAAALLFFVRSGHSTTKGHYRKQVARVAAWLMQSTASGFPAFLRALALSELADATGSAEQVSDAEQAIKKLPKPGRDVEKEVQLILKNGKSKIKPLKKIKTTDDLRLAFVRNEKGLQVPEKLLKDEVGRILAACIGR